MIEQNRALLANPEEEDDDGDPPMRSQVRVTQQDFYVKFRGVMSMNAGSIGIEVMDDVAEAVTDHKSGPVVSLSDAILILPLPSRQCDNKQQPTHPWFAPSQDQQGLHPRPPRRQKKASKKAAQSKRSPADAQSSDPAPVEPTSYFYFELTDRTQDGVRDDLEMIYRTAAQEGVALNAPYKSQQLLIQRHKGKLLAQIARIRFISLCIETWGYSNFLQRFEETKSGRRLMWMEGQPGWNSADAKTYTGPTIENLYELFRRNRAEYNRKIKNASKPFCLDDGGLDSITSMLEHKGALDSNNSKTEHQLSERALGRVLHDIISRRSHKPHWVGTGGVWSVLRNSLRIAQREVTERPLQGSSRSCQRSGSEGEGAEETESKCHVKPTSDEDSEEEKSPPKKPKSKRSTSSENLKAESSSSSKKVEAERPPSPSRSDSCSRLKGDTRRDLGVSRKSSSKRAIPYGFISTSEHGERKTTKLAFAWHGPYRIVGTVGENAYRVAIPTHPNRVVTINVNRLKKFRGRWSRPFPSEIPEGLYIQPGTVDNGPLAEDDLPSTSYVERLAIGDEETSLSGVSLPVVDIIARRKKNRDIQYFVLLPIYESLWRSRVTLLPTHATLTETFEDARRREEALPELRRSARLAEANAAVDEEELLF
ncbi:hypothetical protein GQ600_1486 [Phytophthora cactorum]|nr:hypothetical protein GQ600_1486 [Phytophthora cactorum]